MTSLSVRVVAYASVREFVPLYGLYEVGILLTRLARSPRKPTVEVDTTDATGS